MINILIYGNKGYIARYLQKYLLQHENVKILISKFDKITNEEQVFNDIFELKPDRIISCIGLVKTKTCISTSFLNDDKFLVDNIKNNLYIHILISNACLKHNIHFTYVGTGCIYSSKTDLLFKEDDDPNFFNNKYSIIKGFTDQLLSLNKDNILILRLRQCLNNDLEDQNFLNKFLKFNKVSDIQNSFTVIPSIFPIISKLILEKKCGKFNCVNKGSISVKEIVEIFNINEQLIMNRDFVYENFANNVLSSKKLEELYDIENIKEAILKLKEDFSIINQLENEHLKNI